MIAARRSSRDAHAGASPGANPRRGPINALIDWALGNRFLVICTTLLIVAWGIWAVRNTPVDAIPDLSENQVIVYADWAGRSPQEVEDQVTYPLTTNLQGLAGVKEVRASSMFGFSLSLSSSRTRLITTSPVPACFERLNYLQSLMPRAVIAQLGPDASGLGWVYQYYLKVEIPRRARKAATILGTLRSLQDFCIRYQLAAEEGVAEVAGLRWIRQAVPGPPWIGPGKCARRGHPPRGHAMPLSSS